MKSIPCSTFFSVQYGIDRFFFCITLPIGVWYQIPVTSQNTCYKYMSCDMSSTPSKVFSKLFEVAWHYYFEELYIKTSLEHSQLVWMDIIMPHTYKLISKQKLLRKYAYEHFIISIVPKQKQCTHARHLKLDTLLQRVWSTYTVCFSELSLFMCKCNTTDGAVCLNWLEGFAPFDTREGLWWRQLNLISLVN